MTDATGRNLENMRKDGVLDPRPRRIGANPPVVARHFAKGRLQLGGMDRAGRDGIDLMPLAATDFDSDLVKLFMAALQAE